MKKAYALIAIASLISSAGAAGAYGSSSQGIYPTGHACTGDESWVLGSGDAGVPDDFKAEFNDFLSKDKDPASALRGFAEAIALRKVAKTPSIKRFSEYWISRAIFKLGLPHVAHSGFAAIASNSPDVSTVGVHAAALDCLNQIHIAHPSISVPMSTLTSLKAELDSSLPKKELQKTRQTAWESALVGVENLLGEEVKGSANHSAKFQDFAAILSGGGAYEALAQGLWSAKLNHHYDTIKYLKNFFNSNIPDRLSRYEDTAHLLLARAHYTVGEYDLASRQLKLVSKASNDLADSLSELSWADLMNERYPEAIGTAMNLDAGGLRHTFAPEAPMVSAMAMNELCQYPDAVREIAVFRRNYEKVYHWLSNWVNNESDHPENLYPMAVAFIRKQGTVPDRVAGEWVRSPLFIASQDEINTLFDERDQLPKIGPIASKQMRLQAMEILKHARELKPELKIAKMKLKAGEQLPPRILDSLALLKKQVIHWRRFELAAPVWMAISKRFRGTIDPRQKTLIARIDADIKDMNLRMSTQLDEIAENVQLIEVEIYNGASQDIIWQNAHPDYKQIAKEIKDQQETRTRAKVWDWGRSLASSAENSEIWEDELGSFRANLFDNCSSKDKYLAIRLKRRHGS